MVSLFYPQSVVIVGVSDTPGNLGLNIVENLDRFMFSGEVYLVGRSGGQIGKRSIYRTIEDLPETPELAVILIPAIYVPEALEICGQKGIRRAVIETGGFGEFTSEGKKLEQRLLQIAEDYNIRFVGPNCIGIVNLENGLVLPFVSMDPGMMRKGPVSLVSQSGGIVFGGIKLFSCENIGVNKLFSIGNSVNLNENDYLEYLIQDQETRVIGLYLESIADGRQLMRLAAATDKPIVMLKSNTNPASNEIANFHTSALAGNDRVCDCALSQAGIHRVHSLGEMADLLKVFQLPLMVGNNLAVIGRSGGQIVMAADAAHLNKFHLARFSDTLLQEIGKRTRAQVIKMTNPLDMGDIFDLAFYAEVVKAVLAEPGIDGVLMQHLHSQGTETEVTLELIQNIEKLSQQYQKPVVFCIMAERDELLALKAATEFPLFLEPACALHALAASRRQARHRSQAPLLIPNPARRQFSGPIQLAGIEETFGRLAAAGFNIADYAIANDREEVLQTAERLGYPVALKIESSEVVHKTEAGGVKINIKDRDELEVVIDEMQGCFVPLFAENKAAFMVQKMAPAGIEVILGAKRDPEFGPIVLFGLGGIYVELFQDVAMRVAPIAEVEAAEMIEEIQGHALLAGFRGHSPADVESLKQLLVAFSQILLASPEIENLEINPLIVLDAGAGAVVVDARMHVQQKYAS